MPYKDVYSLGCEIRGRAIEHAQRFDKLRETCEHQIKPRVHKTGMYAGAKLMRTCILTGNAVRLECCMANCKALLE
jgi:hypothetical protein